MGIFAISLAAATASNKISTGVYIAAAIAFMLFATRNRRKWWSWREDGVATIGAIGVILTVLSVEYMHGYSVAMRVAATVAGLALSSAALIWRTRRRQHHIPLPVVVSSLAMAMLLCIATILSQIQGQSTESTKYTLHGLTIFAVVVIAATQGIFNFWSRRQAQANLTALANRLGWQIEEQKVSGKRGRQLAVSGRYRGRELQFVSIKAKQDHQRRQWIALKAELNRPDAASLLVTPNDATASETPKDVSPQLSEARTGDVAFDTSFTVTATSDHVARTACTDKIRRRLQEWRAKSEPFFLSMLNGEAYFVIPGTMANPGLVEQLAEKMDFVCDFADAAEQARA